jgi:hypothetical protein
MLDVGVPQTSFLTDRQTFERKLGRGASHPHWLGIVMDLLAGRTRASRRG